MHTAPFSCDKMITRVAFFDFMQMIRYLNSRFATQSTFYTVNQAFDYLDYYKYVDSKEALEKWDKCQKYSLHDFSEEYWDDSFLVATHLHDRYGGVSMVVSCDRHNDPKKMVIFANEESRGAVVSRVKIFIASYQGYVVGTGHDTGYVNRVLGGISSHGKTGW